MEEIKHSLLPLQTCDEHKVAMSLNWKKGDKVIIPPQNILYKYDNNHIYK